MSIADINELLIFWLWMPINLLTIVICIASGVYVYIDSHERCKSRGVAVCLGFLVSFVWWPLSFVAYILMTIGIDRRANSGRSKNAASAVSDRQPE